MPTQVQFRRANTANTATITGAIGELTVDTDKNVVVVHDGTTAGGHALAKEASPTVTGVFTVTGNTDLNGNLHVQNTATFGNNVTMVANLTVQQQISVVNVATFSNNVVISGNLTVTGTTTYVNTSVLQVSDNIVTLNSDHSGAPSEDAGIEVNRGSSANVSLQWNESDDAWELTTDGSTYYRVLSNNAPVVNTFTTSNTFQLGTTSEAANGYTRLSGGLIMQWGTVSVNSTSGDVTFPIAFPNNLWNVQVTPEGGTYDASYFLQVVASNTTQASINSGNGSAISVYYTAIGN